VNAKATAVWLRLGEGKAEEVQEQRTVPQLNRRALVKLLDELPSLTKRPIDEALAQLQERCLAVGVHVILLPELSGTRACAATRWVAERPVIILSGRGKTQDSLWFNFFHEAGHMLLHSKRRSAVQLDRTGDDADGRLPPPAYRPLDYPASDDP
jgi:HTH-type transcriptional regulator/antitoxin HigA